MIVFAADDPLVRNGTYDTEGFTPKERRAQQRRLQKEGTMAKRASRMDRKLSAPDTPKRGRPKQQDLIEDRTIKPLEDIAESYADVRDQRMKLNQEEAELKKHTLKLMHKYEKTIYRHAGIEIRIVPGEEDVKVKIKKPGEDDEADGETAAIGDADAAEA